MKSDHKIFKFGGASVKDAAGMTNVGQILKHFRGEKLGVVVSATGKTTNHLEQCVNAYFKDKRTAFGILDTVKSNHFQIISGLGISDPEAIADIMDTFVEAEWVLEDEAHDPYDYIYDQVVSLGELVSSKILYHYLHLCGFNVAWLDIRGVLMTDGVHREAKVDWLLSTEKIKTTFQKLLSTNDMVVTQGFIGSTSENHTTTLGREGSDYTAAILSYCTDADSMHIWKDVPGVLTGDPTVFANVQKIERLTYMEAIEMTYYGAKVIHPKTIKPIQNKNIPLYVRPFGDINSLGTKISEIGELHYPPIIVLEPSQALIHISVNDFSFVAEHHIADIFKVLSDVRLKVNMMRNTAISFTICVPNLTDKIAQLTAYLQTQYTVTVDYDLELITIRHYDESTLTEMKTGKVTMFEERLKNTVQLVVKDIPTIKRITE